jgi:hypothetical protein
MIINKLQNGIKKLLVAAIHPNTDPNSESKADIYVPSKTTRRSKGHKSHYQKLKTALSLCLLLTLIVSTIPLTSLAGDDSTALSPGAISTDESGGDNNTGDTSGSLTQAMRAALSKRATKITKPATTPPTPNPPPPTRKTTPTLTQIPKPNLANH